MANEKEIPFLPLAIISFALHVSILLYVGIPAFLASNSPDWVFGWRVFPEQNTIFWTLVMVAVLDSGLAIAFPLISKKGIAAPESAVGGPAPQSLFLNFSPLSMPVQQITIVRMAIAESVAIFGLVLAMLNRSVLVAIPFCLVGLLVQFIVGPIWGKFLMPKSES